MKPELKLAILLISFFLFSGLVTAQSYYFKQLSIQEGVSQSTVQAILCDYKRTLWLGTKDGLNRFDGYELKNYFYNANDSTSLLGSNVFFIAEDARNNLWIGTQRGICLYNSNTDDFSPLLFEGKTIFSRSYTLMEDGLVFIGNGDGYIYKYDYQTTGISRTKIGNGDRKLYFTQAEKLDEHTLLIAGRWSSAYLLNLETGNISAFSKHEIQNVTAMLVEDRQKIWIAQYNKGVTAYNDKGEKLEEYTTANSALKNNVILDLLIKQNQLWMATDGGGINILDLKSNKISAIEYLPGATNTLPVNSITCLYKDVEDNLWAGSVRGGGLGIRNVSMQTYSDVPLGSPNGLSNKSVTSLFEDADHLLWVGTDGGGVNCFDPATNKFTHYRNIQKEKVSSIFELNKEELLLSVFAKGLYRFNKQSGDISPVLLFNKQTTDSVFSTGIPVVIHPGKDKELYILSDKIFLYDPLVKQIKPVGNNLQGSWVQPFYRADNYSYLFSERKIVRLSHATHSLEDVCSIKEEQKITAACFDGKSTIYIGSNYGMAAYDIQSGESTMITTHLFNLVSSILWEREDRIWIGAKNKLFAYNPIENKFVIFGNSDGVLPNELLSRPILKTQQDLYLGGSMGLLRIYKNRVPVSFPSPELHVATVEVDGVFPEFEEEAIVRLPWNFRYIHFNFMVEDSNYFRERNFRYTIYNRGTPIVMASTKPLLALYTLPTGRYTVSAQCDTQNGEWTKPVLCAELIVSPPWWRSTFAIIAYILIGIGIIGIIASYYVRKNKDRLIWERKEQEQKINEEKIKFLININHELRTPLTLIYAPLKQILANQGASAENSQLMGVFKHVRRMRNIINMILDMRKMEVRKETLHFGTYPLNQWIESLVDDFKTEAEAKNIKISVEADAAVGELIFDGDKCEKAFTNILMNALKFSDPDSEVIVSTQLRGDWVRVSAVDQGIGLGGNQEKLFQRFYQGEHNRGGSGIGLSYAKLMIEIQGGKIGAYNNETSGSTFFIELPIRSKTEEAQCDVKPYVNELFRSEDINVSVGSVSLEQYSILIVEDEPELRKFLKDFFSKTFRKVYVEDNGANGFKRVISYQPDIVVSDIMMPVMNGYELCQKIKNDLRCSHIPVILLTAREDNRSTLLGYKTGADAYLSKPFETEILLSVIEAQLKNREYVKIRYKDNTINPLSSQEITFSNADELFMEKLNGVIINNLDQPSLDVKYITQELGVSRSSLYTKMDQIVGLSIGEYIDKLRLQKGEELVRLTDMPLQEIADKTGFSTPRYFSQVFKKTYGVPPSKYRQDQS